MKGRNKEKGKMEEIRDRLRKVPDSLLLGILFLLIFGVAYRNLFVFKMVSNGDWAVWYRTPAEVWKEFWFAWSERGLGESGPLSPGYFILNSLGSIIFIGHTEIAHRLVFLSFIPLAGVNMYLFARKLGVRSVVRILFAWFYGVNSLTIFQFRGGGFPLLFVHAFVPILLLLFLRIMKSDHFDMRDILFFSALLSFVFSLHHLAPLFLAPFFVFLGIPLLVTGRVRARIKVAKIFASLGCVLLLCTLVYIDVFYYIFSYYTESVSQIGALSSSTKDINWLLLHVKMQFTEDQFTLGALRDLTFLTGFLAAVPAMINPLMSKDTYTERKKSLCWQFFFVASSILLFWKGTEMGVTWSFFRIFPVLFGLMHSIKLVYMLTWSLFPVAILGADALITLITRSFKSHKNLGRITISILFVATFFTSQTILTYSLDPPISNSYKNAIDFYTGGVDFSGVEVPRTYEEVGSWLDEQRAQSGFFRSLWIPTRTKITLDILPKFDPLTFMVPPDKRASQMLWIPLIQGWTDQMGVLFSQFNIKYVVINYENGTSLFPGKIPAESAWRTGYPWFKLAGIQHYLPLGDPTIWEQLIQNQQNMRPVVSTSRFSIYENTADLLPLLSVYSKVFVIGPADLPKSQSDFTVAYSQNLLTNPSFEDGVAGWSLSDSNVVLDESEGYMSNSSLKIAVKGQPYVDSGQLVDVKPGYPYILSAWARTENALSGAASVKIWLFAADGTRITKKGFSAYVGEEWNRISGAITVPAEATRALITVQALSAKNQSDLAVTWFDAVEFKEGYKPVKGPSEDWRYVGHAKGEKGFQIERGLELIKLPSLISYPSFEENRSLLVYSDLTPPEALIRYIPIADGVFFFGSPVLDDPNSGNWTGSSAPIVFIEEAESVLRPLQGFWRHHQDSSLAYELAIEVLGSGEAVYEFCSPRPAFYRFVLKGEIDDSLQVSIGSQPINSSKVWSGGMYQSWFETEPVWLEHGPQNLIISLAANSTIDQIWVVSSLSETDTLGNIFSSPPVSLTYTKIDPTRYQVNLQAPEKFFLVFSQTFNREWSASAPDCEINHFPALVFGWANGYLIEKSGSGEIAIHLKFTKQSFREIFVSIWMLAWVLVLTTILGLSLMKWKHEKGKVFLKSSSVLMSKLMKWLPRKIRELRARN